MFRGSMYNRVTMVDNTIAKRIEATWFHQNKELENNKY